jgi:hypothetical protein
VDGPLVQIPGKEAGWQRAIALAKGHLMAAVNLQQLVDEKSRPRAN